MQINRVLWGCFDRDQNNEATNKLNKIEIKILNTLKQYGEEQIMQFLVKDVTILPSTESPKLACC